MFTLVSWLPVRVCRPEGFAGRSGISRYARVLGLGLSLTFVTSMVAVCHAAAPSLTISRSADHLTVDWSAEFLAFRPETTTNLAAPNWRPLSGTQVVGDRCRVSLPSDGPAAMVRLVAPDTGTGSNAGYVSTVAELASLDPEKIQGVVLALGYASRSDGLGGMYFPTNTVTGTNPVTRVASANPAWSWELFSPRPLTVYPLGLRAYVTGGVLTSEGETGTSVGSANALVVAPGEVQLHPGATNFVAVDLYDGTLHVWRRMLHAGAVELARIVTGADGVSLVQPVTSPRFPASPVERFKRKLAEGRTTRAVILGDSLLTQVFPVGWESLLFVPAAGPAGLALRQPTLVDHKNYSLGAVGPLYGMAALGETRGQGKSYYVDTKGIGFSAGSFLESFHEGPDQAPIRRSPALAAAPDLAIVGYYNQSPYRLAYIEALVRQFRSAGAEVLLIASGPNQQDLDYRGSDGGALDAIARAYSCALVDVNSWMREAYEKGVAVWGDGVHQSAAGNLVWARCLRSVLNDFEQPTWNAAPAPVRMMLADQDAAVRAFPEVCDVVLSPAAHDGTWSAPLTNSLANRELQNLARFLGAKPLDKSVLLLEPGQHAIFSHTAALTLDLLVEVEPGASYACELRLQNRTVLLKKLTASWPSGLFPQFLEVPGLTLAECQSLAASGFGGVPTPDLANPSVAVVNTGTNTLRLVGALFGTLPGRELSWADWGQLGPFSGDAGYWTYQTFGTDHIGSALTASFFGRGMQLVLQGGQHAGQIRVDADGAPFFLQDCHRAEGQDAFLTTSIFPDAAAAGTLLSAPRWHSVTVSLVGTNAATVQPTEPGRRHLSLIQGLVF